MDDFYRLLSACDPNLLPSIKEKQPSPAVGKRIRRLVRRKIEKGTKNVGFEGFASAFRRKNAAFAAVIAASVILGVLTVPLLYADGGIGAAYAELKERLGLSERVPLRSDGPVMVYGITNENGKYRITLQFSTPPLEGRFVFFGSMTLSDSEGNTVLYIPGGDTDSRTLAQRIMAADILYAGSVGDTSFFHDISVSADKVQEDEEYTLSVDGLICAEIDDISSEVSVFPLAEEMSVSFRFSDYTGVTEPVTPDEPRLDLSLVNDGRAELVRAYRDGGKYYFTVKLHCEPVGGRFVFCRELSLTHNGKNLGLYGTCHGMTGADRDSEDYEKLISGMLMAGDVLTARTSGADSFTVDLCFSSEKLDMTKPITLTLTEVISAATEDAVDMEIFDIADEYSYTFYPIDNFKEVTNTEIKAEINFTLNSAEYSIKSFTVNEVNAELVVSLPDSIEPPVEGIPFMPYQSLMPSGTYDEALSPYVYMLELVCERQGKEYTLPSRISTEYSDNGEAYVVYSFEFDDILTSGNMKLLRAVNYGVQDSNAGPIILWENR